MLIDVVATKVPKWSLCHINGHYEAIHQVPNEHDGTDGVGYIIPIETPLRDHDDPETEGVPPVILVEALLHHFKQQCASPYKTPQAESAVYLLDLVRNALYR